MKTHSHWKKLICVLLFSTSLYAAPPYTQNLDADSRYWIYTAKKNDNLWELANKYSQIKYIEKIQALNQIALPKQIPPGTVIRIPLAWLNLKNVTAKVIAVEGQPSVIGINNQAMPIHLGMQISNGSQIITAMSETVLLEFDDHSKTLLKQNSHLMFENLQAYDKTGIADSRMLLKKGNVDSVVIPTLSDAGTTHQIRTPSSTMAVRGTVYRVGVPNELNSRTEVLRGKVLAQGANAQTQLLPPETGSLVAQGSAPSAPKDLLPAPDLSSILPTVKGSILSVPFKPLAKAVAYRIEIAPDKEFKSLVYEARTEQPILQSATLQGGNYAARVRGIDNEGLEGMDAVVQFALDVQLSPPFIILPSLNSTVYEPNPVFKWGEVSGAIAYHFQVARTPDFSSTFIDKQRLIPHEFRLADSLKNADYYWRVASIDQYGQEGEFCDVQKFTYQPDSALLAAETARIQAGDLVVRWKNSAKGETYRVQLAEDEKFNHLVTDLNFTRPTITLASGNYFMRVGITDKKTGETHFGHIQKIEIPADYWQTLFMLSPLLFML